MHCIADLTAGNYWHCVIDVVRDFKMLLPGVVVAITAAGWWIRSKCS